MKSIYKRVAGLAMLAIVPMLAHTQTGGTAFLEVYRFRGADSPYLELTLGKSAAELRHNRLANGKFQAECQVALRVVRLPDSAVLHNRTVRMLSPELADTLPLTVQYVLSQQERVVLGEGRYAISAVFADANSPEGQPLSFLRETYISDADTAGRHSSDIVMVESLKPASRTDNFSKYGYTITHNPTGRSYLNADSLKFYWEVYKMPQIHQLGYFVEVSLRAGSNPQPLKGYHFAFRARAPKDLDLYDGGFGISSLPSQTYKLVVEAKRNDGSLLFRNATNVYIYNERMTATMDTNNVVQYDVVFGYPEALLDSLIPPCMYIANEAERSIARALSSFRDKKVFFWNFWAKRHMNPDMPVGSEWFRYYEGIRYANQHFKVNMRDGWRTDRGRILLCYGPPSSFEEMNEPLIYHIWTYYQLKGQSNAIFVFYIRDRSSNDMQLVHSTLRGENFNPEWQKWIIQQADPNSPSFGDRPFSTLPTQGSGSTRTELRD